MRRILFTHTIALFLVLVVASFLCEGWSGGSTEGQIPATLLLTLGCAVLATAFDHSLGFPAIRGGLVAAAAFLGSRWLRARLGWAPSIDLTWGLVRVTVAAVCVVLAGAFVAASTAGVLQQRSPEST
ncbi:MAG: hypothetical protein AB1486_05130 [Planctomycetota bacterium]